MLFRNCHTEVWHFKARKLISPHASTSLLSKFLGTLTLQGKDVCRGIFCLISAPSWRVLELSMKPAAVARKDIYFGI